MENQPQLERDPEKADKLSCDCPHCGDTVEFDKRDAGRFSRCEHCGHTLLLPYEGLDAEQIGGVKVEVSFYQAVFKGTLHVLFSRHNVTPVLTIATLVTINYLLSPIHIIIPGAVYSLTLPIGNIIMVMCLGGLAVYYREIIETAGLGEDELPDMDFGGFYGFWWSVIKTAGVLLTGILLTQMHTIIAYSVLENLGIESPWLIFVLALAGVFLLPAVIMHFSCADEDLLWHPGKVVAAIAANYKPYTVTVALFIVTGFLLLAVPGYLQASPSGSAAVMAALAAKILLQVPAIMAMRAIGFFYAYYC